MRALVNTSYGSPDALRVEEVERPTPRDGQVLIKVVAASLNAADWHLLRADPFPVRFVSGMLKPKHSILGSDIAGRVEAVGRNVTKFKPGDEVYGNTSNSGWGGFAEYACVDEILAAKPANLTFEEAAAVPLAAITALQGLRDKGGIKAGQKVLINGAAGGVGTFAVQLAKSFGTEVTAVCGTSHLDLLRSIGADRVVDYAKEDFTRSGQRYDLILAANGYHPISAYKRALSPNGSYVMSGGAGAQMAQAIFLGPWLSIGGHKRLGALTAKANLKDLDFVNELVAAGRIKPVIDRRFPLRDGAAAFRYLEEGHASGKILITMEG